MEYELIALTTTNKKDKMILKICYWILSYDHDRCYLSPYTMIVKQSCLWHLIKFTMKNLNVLV